MAPPLPGEHQAFEGRGASLTDLPGEDEAKRWQAAGDGLVATQYRCYDPTPGRWLDDHPPAQTSAGRGDRPPDDPTDEP